MPAKNPKHQKKRAPKTYAHKKSYFSLQRKHILGIALIALFTVSAVAFTILQSDYEEWEQTHVQVGDTVTVQYKVWISNENAEKIELLDEGTFTVELGEDETNVTINGQPAGLIYGFYNGLLGMKNGSVTNPLLWLPACVDDLQSPPNNLHADAVAGDGWDDRYAPGKVRCKSYGSGENRYTDLLFYIKIMDLTKG